LYVPGTCACIMEQTLYQQEVIAFLIRREDSFWYFIHLFSVFHSCSCDIVLLCYYISYLWYRCICTLIGWYAYLLSCFRTLFVLDIQGLVYLRRVFLLNVRTRR
jgi:hypothetical protein